MKTDLDCSYKVPFEIRVYHEAQFYALKWGLKWCRLKGNSVYSLRCPNYSLGLDTNIAIRFKRWLEHTKTRNRKS